MRRTSIRNIQHSLAKVLLWIKAGENVTIIKNNQSIVGIRHLEKKTSKIKLPDFKKQLEETFDHPIRGVSNSELISEMRGDR